MTERIEYGSKDAADAARDKHSEYLCSEDDKRLKTVAFAENGTPESVLEDAHLMADDSHVNTGESSGSVPLTDAEKDEIDFSETDTWTARAAKGAFLDEGVSDWLTYWSEDLTTTGEAREAAKRAKQDEKDTRLDAGPTDEERAHQYGKRARQAQHRQCNHIEGECENGDPEACEFLTQHCGYSEEEVSQFIDESTGTDHEQQDLVTVGGDEYPEMEVTPEVAGALRDSWTGYKGGLSGIERALSDAREAVINTRQAWRAINRIREANGQDAMHPDRLHTLLDALDGMPATIPEVRTLDHFAGSETDRSAVLETDDQRTLSGDRADDQARLAGGEQGERAQGEVVDQTEENPGGLLTDERADTTDPEDTEQQVPDAFRVAEGGQETL
ncbi:hypothetical protein [Haloarcula sp. JP-L23]|uniref:hypothetical protein n=1 Tax=Haloarcula sp. JP-L23 TaxID=2716717 RepID=UPI00140F03E2|nr:hypothetical protein G9465_15790 [Haloarcula sp. JP-L23]